jgi:hypothetical protein
VINTTTRSAIDDFLDVVLADEQLLRAEFEAILSAQWPDRREPARPALRRRWPSPDECSWWQLPPARPHPSHFAREASARDRSPPYDVRSNLTKGGDGIDVDTLITN